MVRAEKSGRKKCHATLPGTGSDDRWALLQASPVPRVARWTTKRNEPVISHPHVTRCSISLTLPVFCPQTASPCPHRISLDDESINQSINQSIN
jgi:hypothetical protein